MREPDLGRLPPEDDPRLVERLPKATIEEGNADPVAGAQLIITWSSGTTLRYNMNSIEYFLYGTGELQDISNGT